MAKGLRHAWPLLLLTASVAGLYAPVLTRLAHNWAIDQNYSHGFLIGPVAAYLVWQRRDRLASARACPSAAGLVVVLASLALLLAGVVAAEVFITRISMIGVIGGAVLFVYGRQHLKLVAFPLAFLLLMIPLPAIVFNEIALPLQLLASRLGVAALSLAGVPALREGNVITLAHGSLEVADACSGIRSLISLLALAIIYGCFSDPRALVRVALAVLAIPIAVLVNGLRVGVTGLLQETVGTQAVADHFFHAFSGWVMFLVAFGLVVAAHRSLVALYPLRERTPSPVGGPRPLLDAGGLSDARGI